jgi:hypothetical protein
LHRIVLFEQCVYLSKHLLGHGPTSEAGLPLDEEEPAIDVAFRGVDHVGDLLARHAVRGQRGDQLLQLG